jgi:predicted TIM-barrel fold metal-dependent hydrolase
MRESGTAGKFKDFLNGMDDNGIDMAVLLARPGENEHYHELVTQYPDRLVAFAGVNPFDLDAPEQLERYVREYGFKGLKVHPPGQFFSPTDPCFIRLVKKTIELDIPILIHTGPSFIRFDSIRYGDPLLIDDLALSFQEAKIIQAHANPLGDGPVLAGKHPNVYMDTTIVFARMVRLISGLGEDTLEWMSLAGQDGSRKVLFGSDSTPTHTERWSYNLEPIRDMDVPEEVKARILGENAAELLKL